MALYDNSTIEKLKVIGQLYTDGIITKEEMEAEKNKILGKVQQQPIQTENEPENKSDSSADAPKTDEPDTSQQVTSEVVNEVQLETDKSKNKKSLIPYILLAIGIVSIPIIVIVLFSHFSESEDTDTQMADEEVYDVSVPIRIHVDNSMTLDELFCEEHVGDTIDYFEQGDLTHSGDYKKGPIALAIEHAEYIDCEMAGPRTGMHGVIKSGYKGYANTYYCEGSTAAGSFSEELIWVYNSETKRLYAHAVPHFTYLEFYNLFKKYESNMHRGKLPESFEAGGLNVKKIKKIRHTICEYDEILGGPLTCDFYVYASDNVSFSGLDFSSEGYDFCQPIFSVNGNDDLWLVAVFTDYGYKISFYTPEDNFASIILWHQNDDPIYDIGYYDDDYFVRQYITYEDKNCTVYFVKTPTVNEISFWILGYE